MSNTNHAPSSEASTDDASKLTQSGALVPAALSKPNANLTDSAVVSSASASSDTAPANDALALAFIALLKKDAGITTKSDATTSQAPDKDGLVLDFLQELAGSNDGYTGPTLQPDLAAVAILLARAIEPKRNYLRDLKTSAPIATIATGNSDFNQSIEKIIGVCLAGSNRNILSEGDRHVGYQSAMMVICRDEGERKSSGVDRNVSHCIHRRLPLIGVAADPMRDLNRDINRAAHYRFHLPMLDASAISLVIESVYGTAPTRVMNSKLARLIDVSDLGLAFRPDLTPDEALTKLETLLTEKTKFDDSGPGLDELFGYGDAKRWGMDLVADLDLYRAGTINWSDIDGRGLLLSGPPGVGKTSFAKALSKTARVPLVAASVAQWNASEYLSGTLSAIRKSFADARKLAPCIMLIDEIDGIGNRANLTGDYVEYWTQIVNCLLEELAGVENRDGVVVIGCSNHPDAIDPAVRRAGRLDREIRIALPETEDLARIFRHHLGLDTLVSTDLMPVAVRANGKSGADVEAFCRRAKGAARRAKRDLTVEDLMSEVSGSNELSKDLPAALRHRIAIHEAGHAVAALHYGLEIGWIAITPKGGETMSRQTYGSNSSESETAIKKAGRKDQAPMSGQRTESLPGQQTGAAPELTSGTMPGTVEDVTESIIQLLAGHAAETVFFSTRLMANAGQGSDLAQATALAVGFETTSGLGHTGLVQMPTVSINEMSNHSGLYGAVRKRLDAAMEDAVAIVTKYRAAAEVIADALERQGYLSGDAVLEIASMYRPADNTAQVGEAVSNADTGAAK